MGRLAIVTDGYWLVVLTDRAVEDRERAGRWQERICGQRLPSDPSPSDNAKGHRRSGHFWENSEKKRDDRSRAGAVGDRERPWREIC
jgi:hypothetical protein